MRVQGVKGRNIPKREKGEGDRRNKQGRES